MNRYFLSCGISDFLVTDEQQLLGALAAENTFSLEITQRDAWLEEIRILKRELGEYATAGTLYFEYSIPRLGRRIDVVAVIRHVIFVLEFKVGEREFAASALDQVWDYALDLKNFHETSHKPPVVPVLIATEAEQPKEAGQVIVSDDNLVRPVRSNGSGLTKAIQFVLDQVPGPPLKAAVWEQGRYYPTPTIVEAATALYGGHTVEEISRMDAGAINLSQTSDTISRIIDEARARSRKAICFVTGVPGAGKTLVGLNIANKHSDKDSELYSVFLSGNGPLVSILCEALARDKVRRARLARRPIKKSEALSTVKRFVQNVHHFRDECLVDATRPPIEHVALFDEAQRAWNRVQTESFMQRKKHHPNFGRSEPEYLISCLDRHLDWAVIVCLVGGGQEINTGEAGIGEWIESLERKYRNWDVYLSSRLTDSEYAASDALGRAENWSNRFVKDELHLAVSMRSFRAENVSLLVKQLLDLETDQARQTLAKITGKFPIVVTRQLAKAKQWLKEHARGTERYGIVVSSQAERLKPHAIDVKSPMDPVHWFLDGKEDVRSSYYLEDVATEFHVQGLELDWACVTWDADFRYRGTGWDHWTFHGSKWKRIRMSERQTYLKNSYRVLLTRARQGMAIVVPEGETSDPTRDPAFYDSTFEYLRGIGFAIL
jgi:hypothetical protein